MNYHPIFVFVAETPKLWGGIPAPFSQGPKANVIKTKNQTCQTKGPIKR